MINTLKMLENDLTNSLSDKKSQSTLNISDVVENYEGYIRDFKSAVALLSKAIKADDKITIQCALTRVRISSLNLSNSYQDIIDDVMLINSHDSWTEIPDDYQIPEHYDYPSK